MRAWHATKGRTCQPPGRKGGAGGKRTRNQPAGAARGTASRSCRPNEMPLPARVAPALPVRLPAAAPQEQEEPAPGLPVGADVLAYPLPARHRDALLAEAAGGPVRAPALRKPVLRRPPPLPGHLPGNGRGRAAPRRGLALRLPVPASAPAAVAPDLAPDSRPVPAQLPGNGQVGQSAFPRRVYLASFAMGQVAAAARHDSLHASSQGVSPPSGRFATSCAEGRRSPPPLVLHFRVARGPYINATMLGFKRGWQGHTGLVDGPQVSVA